MLSRIAMRKILILSRDRVAAVAAVVQRASLAAFGASLAVTLCCFSIATAQSPRPEGLFPGNFEEMPLLSGQNFSEVPTGSSANSLLADSSAIEPAAYRPIGQSVRRGIAAANHRAHRTPDPCNPGCDVSWYVNYDALWLRREGDERFSLSRNSFLPDFDYERGGRYTVGRLLDCVNGWEASYVGPYNWDRSATVTGAGTLQSRLTASNGFGPADIDTFNNANSHTQIWSSELDSFELNRRWWTWDVLSTLIGIRYIDYEENYLLSSLSPQGNGLFSERVENKMIGAQVGADIMYPVSLRTNVGFRGKAGVYANFDERTTFLSNDNTILLNAGDDSVEVAGLIEMGVFANYQIVPSVRLTAGYEFWYLPGIATVPEQGPSLITPASGTTVFNDSELFLHGGSVGVQVLF